MKGFTLVEVLVALGMVAVALAAGLSLSGSLVQRAERAPELVLAELCARNRFAALRLARELPPAGEEQTTCVQAGRPLQVLSTVTAVGDFRQVQVQVRSPARAGAVVLSLATVLGRY
jgi:general secretion pathway protein I